MLSAQSIAKLILLRAANQGESDVSNLKLQKLLYYSQGFHLALVGSPCFEEPILAWDLGPVVPDVYREYKNFTNAPIPEAEGFDPSEIPEETRGIVEEVYETYGQFSAWRLSEMTHEERPWKETPRNSEIPHRLLKEFFAARVREA